jgi:RecG-like helicase
LEDEIFNEFKCSSDYTKEKLIYLARGNRVIDLLLFSPIEYITFSLLQNKTNKPEGAEVVVDVLILNHEPSFKISSKNPYKINAEFDDGNSLVISFFAGNASMWKAMFKENSKYKSEKSLPVIYTNIKNIIKTDKIGTVITSNTKLIKI